MFMHKYKQKFPHSLSFSTPFLPLPPLPHLIPGPFPLSPFSVRAQLHLIPAPHLPHSGAPSSSSRPPPHSGLDPESLSICHPEVLLASENRQKRWQRGTVRPACQQKGPKVRAARHGTGCPHPPHSGPILFIPGPPPPHSGLDPESLSICRPKVLLASENRQ